MFLCRAVERHRCELEADMQEVYGVDIERPGCSLRHLACLAAQLGPRSRTMAAVDGALAWGDSEYILALLTDNVAMLRHELAGCRGKGPQPVPRPGDRARAAKTAGRGRAMTREQVARALAAPRV